MSQELPCGHADICILARLLSMGLTVYNVTISTYARSRLLGPNLFRVSSRLQVITEQVKVPFFVVQERGNTPCPTSIEIEGSGQGDLSSRGSAPVGTIPITSAV
jgi:hypothetical protein